MRCKRKRILKSVADRFFPTKYLYTQSVKKSTFCRFGGKHSKQFSNSPHTFVVWLRVKANFEAPFAILFFDIFH